MNLKKQRIEIAVTSLIMGIACYLQYVAYTSKVRTKVQGMKSMTFPKVILYGIIVLCAVTLIRGILNYRKLKKQEAGTAEKTTGKVDFRIPMTVGMIILYALLWNVLGFVISSMLFVCVESILLDRSKPWWQALIIGVAYVIIVYLIFGAGFKVNFPEPILDAVIG